MGATFTVSEVGVTQAGAPTARLSHEDGRTVLELSGEHDVATLHDLVDKLVVAICESDSAVVVDLAGVTFLGAAPVGAILRARAFLRGRGRTLTLRAPSSSARRVLELCELTDFIVV